MAIPDTKDEARVWVLDLLRDPARLKAVDEALLLEIRHALGKDTEAAVRRAVKTGLRLVEQDEPAQPAPRPSNLKRLGYPALPGPVGWTVDEHGVTRHKDGPDGPVEVQVCPVPVGVVKRYRDVDTERWTVTIAWLADGAVRSLDVPRSTVADARSIVGLADHGLPVASTSARELVAYLAAQEALIREAPAQSVARCGWVGSSAFVVGSRCIGAEEIHARTSDEGAIQLARALEPAGTWERWVRVVEHLTTPHLWLALYAACASPIMGLIDLRSGAVVNYCAPSSTGKSTAQRLAASVWGTSREGAGLVRTWEATATKIERDAAFLTDLGLILDDVAKVPPKRRPEVVSIVYQLANGAGRGRGAVGGSQAIASWRLVALSSSEAPLATLGGQQGASARVLEVFGAPCLSGAQAVALDGLVADDYGHLGPRVVEHLLSLDRARLKQRYQAIRDRWEAQHPGIAARLGSLVGVLVLAADAIHAVGLPKPTMDVWSWLGKEADRHAADSDRAEGAWETYRARLRDEVARRRWPDDRPPSRDTVAGWLVEAGYDPPGPTMQEWVRRGWVRPRKDKPGQMARVNGVQVVDPMRGDEVEEDDQPVQEW